MQGYILIKTSFLDCRPGTSLNNKFGLNIWKGPSYLIDPHMEWDIKVLMGVTWRKGPNYNLDYHKEMDINSCMGVVTQEL